MRSTFRVFFSTSSPKPSGFWNCIHNQRKFMDGLLQKLNIANKPQEWPTLITRRILAENGGGTLHNKYNSVRKLLQHIYPEQQFLFPVKPRSYWNCLDNQRKFMDQEMKRRNMKHLDEWNTISVKDFISNGGKGAYSKHKNFFELLCNVYPNHSWDVRNRRQHPKYHWTTNEKPKPELKVKTLPNHWKSLQNQKQFFDELGTKLGVTSLFQWDDISSTIVIENEGSWVFNYYASLLDALQTLYPDHPWEAARRFRKPRNYWDSQEHIQVFMKQMKEKYKIENKEDWYRVSKKQFIDMGGYGLIAKYKGLCNLLKEVYPDETWNDLLFKRKDKRSAQRFLFITVASLFPSDVEVLEEFVYDVRRESNLFVEYDVFVPSFSLAFEYQGEHHYKELPNFGPLELYQQRDEEKVILSKKNGIHMIAVPFTWDLQVNSLLKLIEEKVPRSDLLWSKINKEIDSNQ